MKKIQNKKNIEIIKMDSLNLNKKDFLSNKIYSDELYEKIVNYFNSEEINALYIGVIGNWGSGKSAVVDTAISELNKEINIFKYDAWKYENDGFRRNFIKSMLEQSNIKPESEIYQQINCCLYEDSSISTNSMIERIELSKQKDKKYNSLRYYIIAIIVLIVFIIYGFYVIQKYENLLGSLLTILGTIGFFNVLYSQTTYSKSRLFSPEQFYNEFRKILVNTKGNKNLIFIDNLDRCDRDNMLLTLKCMKSFYLDSNDNKMKKEKILFIIPFDIDSLKGAPQDKQYDIDKVFDDIIYLKNTTTTDRIDFINQLLNENQDINDIIPPNARDILAKSFVKTPREIIKMINNYVTEYEIICKKNSINFINNVNNQEYLMKYVILNRKYPDFINLAYSDMISFVNIENAPLMDEIINKEYGDECCEFLNMSKSIKPTNYYDFYFNQKQKKYSLPDKLEEAIQIQSYEVIRQSNLKKNIINYYKDSIYFDIDNKLWKISIGNKFLTFMNLSLEEYFNKDEVNDILTIWNKKIFNNKMFYDEVIVNKSSDYEQIILFLENNNINIYFAHKLFEFLRKGNVNMPLLDSSMNNKMVAKLLGSVDFDKFDNEELSFLNAEYCNIFSTISLPEDKQLFALPYINLTQYISENNLNAFISRLNEQDINIIISLFHSFEQKKIQISTSTREYIINYVNRCSANIKNYTYLEQIIKFIFEFNNNEYLRQLNIIFNCDEPDKVGFIPTFLDEYIKCDCLNDTFRGFIRKFKLNNNVDEIFKYISNYMPETKNNFIDEFVNYFNNSEISHLRRNYNKIAKFYKNGFVKQEIISCLKCKNLIEEFYFSNITSAMKKEIISETERILQDNNDKIQNLFIYESNPEKFIQFIGTINSINEIIMVMLKCKKSEFINNSCDRLIEIVNSNDIINSDDFDNLYNLFNSSILNKNQIRAISTNIIDKIEIDNLNRLKNSGFITNRKVLNMIEEKISEQEDVIESKKVL